MSDRTTPERQPRLVRRLWDILTTGQRRRLVLVVGVALLAAASDAAVVYLIGPVIDSVVGGSGGVTDDMGSLIIFGAVVVIKNLLVVVLAWVKNRELFAIQAETSERLVAIYIRGRNPAIGELDAGQRTSFAITEPFQLVMNCYLPVVTLIAEAFAIAAVTMVLLVERPAETIVLMAALGIMLATFSRLTRRRIVDYGHRRKNADTKRQEILRSVIESRVEVNGLGVAPDVLHSYGLPNHESANMTARKAFLTEASKNVLELLVLVSVGPLALLFSYSSGAEFVAMLAMYGVAAYRAMPALNRIMVANQSLKFGVATADAIGDILLADDEAPRTVERSSPRPPTTSTTLRIDFGDFRLRNGKSLLDQRTIELTDGDVCVIWGPSGSGKSTILDALIDGNRGVTVHVNGHLAPNGLSDFPGLVGVTAQSPLVLPDTLQANLTLGTGSSAFDVTGAAELLDSDPSSILSVAEIHSNLNVPIHRHRLSGGQAQRVSLLRALDDSHSIVVLDEPTSALDERASAALIARLEGDREGRIYVVVTHDAALRSIATELVDLT